MTQPNIRNTAGNAKNQPQFRPWMCCGWIHLETIHWIHFTIVLNMFNMFNGFNEPGLWRSFQMDGTRLNPGLTLPLRSFLKEILEVRVLHSIWFQPPCWISSAFHGGPLSVCPLSPTQQKNHGELVGKGGASDYYSCLVVWTPLQNDGVSNSWDDDIPNWMESQSKFHGSSHHQPDISLTIINQWKNKSHVPVTTKQIVTWRISGLSWPKNPRPPETWVI